MAKKFGKITIIYAIGQLLSKAIGFLLIPLYTSKLGTDGYGQLAITDMIYNLLVNIITFQINTGYTRYYYTYSKKDRKKLKDTAITFAIICSVGFLLVNLALGRYYSGIILDIDNSYKILILLIFMSAVEQISYVCMIDFSMQYKAMKIVNYQIMKLIVNLIFVIYYVAYKNMGILGMYKGYCISNMIILIAVVFFYKIRIKIYLDKKMLKEMFVYSIQLVPTNIAYIILNLGDRYILSIINGVTATGIYSLGYKYGMLFQPLVIEPFKKVFTPYKYEISSKENSNNLLNKWFIKYNLIGVCIVFQISILVKFVIMVTSPKEFLEAYKIVPLIVISFFVYGKSEFYNLGIYLTNKTRYVSYIMILSGILNIMLNFLLIPILGMYGAALATIIAYLITNVLFIKISNKCCDIRYKNNKEVKILYAITLIIYIAYFFVSKFTNNLLEELINIIIINLIWAFFIIKYKILNDIINKEMFNNIYLKIKSRKNGRISQ